MADRFFPNEMPRFVAETTLEEEEEAIPSQTPTPDSLTPFLSLPYQTLSAEFQAAALRLKQSVLQTPPSTSFSLP